MSTLRETTTVLCASLGLIAPAAQRLCHLRWELVELLRPGIAVHPEKLESIAQRAQAAMEDFEDGLKRLKSHGDTLAQLHREGLDAERALTERRAA